jgi:hypothetical protein
MGRDQLLRNSKRDRDELEDLKRKVKPKSHGAVAAR